MSHLNRLSQEALEEVEAVDHQEVTAAELEVTLHKWMDPQLSP
jgi:hypothetical protein